MKTIIILFTSILFNIVMGVAIAPVLGVDPLWTVGGLNALALIPKGATGLMAGVNKEIWIAEILEKFYPDWSFLREARGMDEFVENNTINLAEAGVDPNVLVNNTTYPIPFARREDIPLALPLDTYDTENTLVRNIEEIESAYNKMQSVLAGHKNSLLNFFSRRAAHAYAPNSNTTQTPVIATSGALVDGFRVITLKDILDLATRFDEIDAPEGSRVLVMNPRHLRQLADEDAKLFKGFLGTTSGFDLFGFKVYKYSQTPLYNASTGAKKAFGSAAAPTTDTPASIAFINTEVMRAQGTIEMFARMKDPGERGDVLGFQMRALALPFRQKFIGGIFSART
ncbi:MAG TPA: hypothetical protein VLH56_16935 [Dissulfurispiraceae bacterium]|nr:hypothetical protein [Dissulfurispiraceae bacterium]